jgi:hypothetical protein
MDWSSASEMDDLFERALVTTDEAYLRAERRLRAEEAEGLGALRQNLEHADPLGRLIARVTVDWAEASGDDFEKAGQYLDALPAYYSRTAARVPPVGGVEHMLTTRFDGRLGEFLALRLVKETTWPHWRVMTVLAYLDRHKNPATTDALIRFAVQTPDERWRTAAIDVLKNMGDPALGTKLAAERQRLQQQGGTFPIALAALASSLGQVA